MSNGWLCWFTKTCASAFASHPVPGADGSFDASNVAQIGPLGGPRRQVENPNICFCSVEMIQFDHFIPNVFPRAFEQGCIVHVERIPSGFFGPSPKTAVCCLALSFSNNIYIYMI